ncbi:MAG: hypothetical protein BWX88_03918 [Planctomycetes bacterium ADurb.Bin126]|nr:MAG: hypothetical protein BWX88_03918 [Planctomycetes bacterium ADurb.Bin126]HOD81433.1 DUF819 family protein [Phycisphaerae bacterium]HQL75902.1 DUF819 family protein [Phycisphaerae bacterium]
MIDPPTMLTLAWKLPTREAAAVGLLLAIEAAVLLFARTTIGKKVYKVLPAVFYIYFLPALAANLALLPTPGSIVDGQPFTLYKHISDYFLPPALLLLMISVDLPAVGRLGGRALAMVLTGSVGIVLGGFVSLLIFQPWLSPQAWSGFGALSGSWIGGSGNMIAVARGLDTPQEVFSPMLVVDIVVGYGWMGVVIALSRLQGPFDRWSRADRRLVADLNERMAAVRTANARPPTVASLLGMAGLAALGTWFARWAGHHLPAAGGVVSSTTWTIIIVTTLGLGLSLTPVRRLESYGASKLGYLLLYLVLTAIGAQADLSGLRQAPLLIAAGVVWLLIHAACLLLGAKLLRAPMFLAATASQANVGGTASAPVVAAAYQKDLASVGLLMAIVGMLAGTYLGIVCGQLCRIVPWIYGMT